MLKRAEYAERVAKTLNFESRVYSDFEKLCIEERIYPSHKLQELMIGELEKKGVGLVDPLNIRYRKQAEKPLSRTKPIETLDFFLDTGLFTTKTWDPVFKEIDDSKKMTKVENMLAVMHSSAKNRNYFLQTGRAVVTSGKYTSAILD